MKTYEVVARRVETFKLRVEADGIDEAGNEARAAIAHSDDPAMEFEFMGTEIELFSVFSVKGEKTG